MENSVGLEEAKYVVYYILIHKSGKASLCLHGRGLLENNSAVIPADYNVRELEIRPLLKS